MGFVDFFIKYRNATVVYVGIFMSMIGFGMIMPLLPIYARTMGASMFQLGFMASMFAITRTILLTPFGTLSDRHGRKIMLVAGFFLYSVDMFLYSTADSITLLFVYRGLQGVASAMVWPSASALIADTVEKRERGLAMSYFSMSTDLGFIFGPSFGGILQDLYGLQAPFIVACVIMFLITIFIFLWIKEGTQKNTKVVEKKGIFESLSENINMVSSSSHSVTLWGLMISGFIFTFTFSFIQPMLPVYAVEKVGASGTQIGLVFTITGIMRVIVTPFAGSLSDRIGRRRPIIWGGIASSILTFPMAFIRTPLDMIIVMTLRAGGWAFNGAPTQALMIDVVEEDRRGGMFGLLGTVQGIGMIAGPIIGGLLYDLWGGETSFIITGFLALMGSAVLIRMIKEPKNK